MADELKCCGCESCSRDRDALDDCEPVLGEEVGEEEVTVDEHAGVGSRLVQEPSLPSALRIRISETRTRARRQVAMPETVKA